MYDIYMCTCMYVYIYIIYSLSFLAVGFEKRPNLCGRNLGGQMTWPWASMRPSAGHLTLDRGKSWQNHDVYGDLVGSYGDLV